MTLNIPPIETFLFDLDGTLADSHSPAQKALSQTMKEVTGKVLSHADLERVNGLPSHECLAIFSGGQQMDVLTKVFSRNLEQCMVETLTLFPGTEDLLEELHHAGVQMAIVTSQNRSELLLTRRVLGLDRWINEWVTLEDVSKRKPDPEPVQKAVQRLNSSPAGTLMIGDTEYDLYAGRGAGVRVGIAGWGAADLDSLLALSPDFVLPPFENVQADSDGAKVWNRRYDLDGSGLLSKVLIGNESFFSRPMSMDMTVNGRKVAFRPSGSQMLMNKKGRAIFERTLTSPELDLKTVTTIEFDGMVRVDMTLIPKKELSLDRFSYAFHLPRKNALFTHFIGAPNSHISIMIPKESFSMPVPKENGEFFREPFKSLVWFGNHDKGFLWFCGSERNWSPQDQSLRPSALTASATDREVSFQTVPVSAPYVIQAPVTYTFGFFATPVRPMPEGWRDWFCSTRRGIYDSETRHGKVGTLPMIWPDEYREVSAYPRIRKNADKVKQWAQELHDSGRPALTYCDPIRVGIGYLKYLDAPPKGQQLNDLYLAKDNAAEDVFLYRTPELAENMKNWQTLPELIYNYGAAHGGLEVRVSSASGWADFFCFLVEKMAIMGIDGFGDIDNCFPIRDMNEAHGAGYVDQNGVRRYEWDWFARLDLMKRIAAIFLKTRGKPGILVAHSSATWSIPFISFCDANMTFEHSNSGYFSNPGFLSEYGKHNPEITADMKTGGKQFLRYVFPKERWQAELTGTQFGLPCIVMSNLTKSPQVDKEYAKSKRAARELGAFVAAHDCLLWPIWCNTAPLIRLIEIRKEFGLGNKDVEFFPYWSDANPVKSSNPAISVTTYRRPGKLLLNVCNLTDSEAEASLEFGSLVPVQILNSETGKNRILEQGKLKVKVEGRDYLIYTVVLK